MTSATGSIAERLVDLREAFDRSFVEPTQPNLIETEDLLAIRVNDRPYAVRLSTIASLAADRPITALPGAPPRLLGVAALRGVVVPVYDLADLLGLSRSTPPRWTILTAAEPPMALAFDGVDGHLRLPREAISTRTDGAARTSDPDLRDLATDLVQTPTGTRAVVDVPGLHAAIVAAVRSSNQGRKR
jgi:chemotaxis signal transduction protein